MCKPEMLKPVELPSDFKWPEPLDIHFGCNGRMYYTIDGERWCQPRQDSSYAYKLPSPQKQMIE